MSHDVDWDTVEAFREATGVSDVVLKRIFREMPPDEGQSTEELSFLIGISKVMACLPPELQKWLITQAEREVRADR